LVEDIEEEEGEEANEEANAGLFAAACSIKALAENKGAFGGDKEDVKEEE